MGIISGIGSFLGGLFGIGSNSDQDETNAQLQAQIDADNKRDRIQGIVSCLGLIVGSVALFLVFRKK
jgi:hypothetical protein